MRCRTNNHTMHNLLPDSRAGTSFNVPIRRGLHKAQNTVISLTECKVNYFIDIYSNKSIFFKKG